MPAVSFQAELAFQRVEDRLDDLTDRLQLPGAGSLLFAFQAGPNQFDAMLGEAGLEFAAGFALVGDDGSNESRWR